MSVTVLTDQTLQSFVDANPIAVIRFHAPWCGACKIFGPVFDSVAGQIQGIGFAEVNTEQQPVASQYFRIQALPTTIIVKDGRVVDQHSGSMDPNRFANWLAKYITPQQQPRRGA